MTISTENAPKAIGPYSQGRMAEHLIFVSGQLGVDPKSGAMPESAAEQTEQSLKNICEILKAKGCGMDSVVKTTVFTTCLGEFGAINEAYAKFFPNEKPARSCVEVSGLPKGAKVEIEAVAVAGDGLPF